VGRRELPAIEGNRNDAYKEGSSLVGTCQIREKGGNNLSIDSSK
jgi:hypothetical protein